MPGVQITYWEKKSDEGRYRHQFDFIASPYEAPRYFEAVEYCAQYVSVEHALKKGGYIYLGTATKDDPHEVDGVKEIVDIGSKPDLRSLRQLTVAYFDFTIDP